MCSLLMFFPLALAYPFFPLSQTQFPPPGQCDLYTCSQGSTSTDLLSTCLIYSYDETPGKNYSSFTGIGCKNYGLHNNFCDINRLNVNDPSTYNVKCTKPTTNYTLLYPGETPCWSDSGCINNKCVDYTCVGFTQGENCENSYECQPGLSCKYDSFTNATTCENLIRPIAPNCTSDTDCVNDSGCDYKSDFDIGYCRPYFSVPIGETVLQCDNYINMLCKYLQCAPANETSFICVKPSVGLKQLMPCESGKECVDKTSKYYSQCQCGLNSESQAYCQPFPGDEVTVALLASLKKWVSSKSILACSSDQRWDFKCMMKWEPKLYDKIKYDMLHYLNYSAIQDNSDCVKEIFTYMYWDAKENTKISSYGQYLSTLLVPFVVLGF